MYLESVVCLRVTERLCVCVIFTVVGLLISTHFPAHVLFAIAFSFRHIKIDLNSKKRIVVQCCEIGDAMGHVRLLVQSQVPINTHTHYDNWNAADWGHILIQ